MMIPCSFESPALELIPARERHLAVLDVTSMFDEFNSQFEVEWRIRFIYLEDKEEDAKVGIDFEWLGLPNIERLAAGEEIRSPIGKVEAPGRLRLMRGHEREKLVMVLLELLPDEAVPQGMAFDPWFRLRFPGNCSYLHESRNEDWWVLLHGLWAEETRPGPTLAPDDRLLQRAVLNNQEDFLKAILAVQPRIELPPGTEKSLTETAVGMAMENTGMFGAGPGFACGCHRNYRDKNYSMAEDSETWVPRAERITEILKSAGAIDYSPILAACRAGHTAEVEAMLKAGFPPNFSIYGHTTPLLEAIRAGHEDLCDLLLCHGADPNMPRPFSTSLIFGGEIYPITMATEHPPILKRLLEAGANPSIRRDDWDETPVVIVADYGTQENAEEIFSLVDFVSIRGKNGRSGVFYLNAKNLAFCRDIIPAKLLDAYDDLSMTPLLHAIISEDPQKALLLIEMGADPALPGMVWETVANAYLRSLDTGHIPSQLLTPIQAALIYGQTDLVEILIDKGAKGPRYSQVIRVPRQMDCDTFEAWRDKLKAELDALDPALVVGSNGNDFGFDEKTFALETRLATLLMNDPSAAARYPEWLQALDLVEWAEEHGLHPALIEPFRSGRKLDKAGWMKLAEEALVALQQESDALVWALAEDTRLGTTTADACDMLRLLDHAERAWLDARQRIAGRAPEPLCLSSEACERASGEFDGGSARARRESATTGEVGFDDFIDCLKESMNPGSTMDLGKLIHAVRLITVRLKKRCTVLRRKIGINS